MATRHAHERNARERARDVHLEYGITNWPLVPEEIADAVEVPIETGSGFPRNTYGALYKSGNNFRIVISTDSHGDGQRRFTICHELGHFFLDGHVEVLFDGGADVHMSNTDHFRGKKDWYEVEADAFAAELLVPSSVAKGVIARSGPGLAAVRALESTFQTSLSCAAVRFANLTPDPAAVLLSFDRSIEWVSWSPAMQRQSWTRNRFKGEWAPPRSATYGLARSPERVLHCDSGEGTSLLAEWFDGAPAVEVTEEAVGLGGYGRVLTLLTCEQLPSPDRQHLAREREEARKPDWREALRPWSWDKYEDVDDD